jgi:hypothetical protein
MKANISKIPKKLKHPVRKQHILYPDCSFSLKILADFTKGNELPTDAS